jgi:hypothetical protein
MTVAEFYHANAHDGRAVVTGTWREPTRWLVCLRGADGPGYWLCDHDYTVPIRQVGGDDGLEHALRARTTPGERRPRWSRAVRP